MRQATEVGMVWRLPVKARMRAPGIVKAEVATDRGAGLGNRIVGSEIHLLILHRAPTALNEDVVAPCTLAVHADGDAVPDEDAGEVGAGELAALIGVEDVRSAVPGKRLFKRLDAESRLHGDR